jgi:hypothetical protein
MKLLQLTTFLLLSVGVLPQTVSAGPFEGLRNFFTGHRQEQERPVHVRHPHKEAKEAPNGSPSPVAPAVDQQPNSQQSNSQQPNSSPGPLNTLNTTTITNRPGRPAIAEAALF